MFKIVTKAVEFGLWVEFSVRGWQLALVAAKKKNTDELKALCYVVWWGSRLSHSPGFGKAGTPIGGNEAPGIGKECAGGKQKMLKKKTALLQQLGTFLFAV